jgi:hypothetical protein
MSVARGPSRIVLLRSGVYDYAELELHEPIHLVAANNVGKTSLISALQFLYIDDARQMDFSHDFADTRRHYFPESGSLVLFECMTPTGFQVFGLRGLGPVQGFEYERFAYSGQFRREDFIGGRLPRLWEETARRLIDRDLRQVEPKHLRASLTGVGDAKGPPLGLVPLKRSGSYESFRFLFRNLLRLSRIEQDRLKRLFIDITPNLRKTAIDLKKDYADLFHKVDRQSQEVMALRAVESLIADLVRQYAERREAQGRLATMWKLIERALEVERVRVAQLAVVLDSERAALRTQKAQLEEGQTAAVAAGNALSEQAGRLDEQRRQLESIRETARSFVPEIEAAIRSQLQADYDALTGRLEVASNANGPRLERDLADVARRLREDRRLVERFGEAVVTWLRAKSGLNDDALSDVFSVLDPALLGELLGDGRVEVTDDGAAIKLVQQIASSFGSTGFSVPGVRVQRHTRIAANPLEAYANVAAIRMRISEQEADEARLKGALADVKAREQLLRDRALVEGKRREAEARLQTWEAWNTRAPELGELVLKLSELRRQANENAAVVQSLGQQLLANTKAMSEKDRMAEEAHRDFNRQATAVRALNAAPVGWDPTPATEELTAMDLDSLVRGYRSAWTKHAELNSRVDELFGQVKHRTAERIVGMNDDDTIDRLQDELSALENRDRSVRELWASLVDAMRNAFKALLDSLEEIRKEVSRLTAALGRRKVSNLERIELELVPQRDLIQKIKAVIDAEDAPLFAGPLGRSRAAIDVQKWMEDKPRLDLSELFDLRFTVVDVHGQVKSFDSLSKIESQGTSTTIKVLVHLELLRALLSDDTVRVPFFLDEVAELDPRNQRALTEHAVQMGFVPVFASPEPRDCVETLYFLRPQQQGRLVLDETSRVRLRVEARDAP